MRRLRPHRPMPALRLALVAGCTSLLLTMPVRAEVVLAPGQTTAATGATSGSGSASSTGPGVKVGGKLTNTVAIDELESSASGRNARTVVETNRITNTTVGGDLTATTQVDQLTQRAEGRDATAMTVIGTIENVTTGGDLTNTVTLGTSLNVAIGDGAWACVELGTLGGDPVCR
ncbi:MAG: hypothetical protein R3D25_23660 [Geminicoccaceae bacterium]